MPVNESPRKSGLEPQIGGDAGLSTSSGFEPSLGGLQRFEMRVWSKLIDPRWPHKETLVAGLTTEACQLYARVLIQILPGGASFSERIEGGAALSGHYSTGQRAAATFALGLIGGRVGPKLAALLVDPLAQRLSDDDEDNVRVETARALGMLGDLRAQDSLIRAMATGNWKLRLAVIQALGQVGDLASINYIAQLYDQSESLNESRASLEALGLLGGRIGGAAQARVYDQVMRVFLRSDSLQRGAAARALGRLGDRRALDLLIQVAMNGKGDLQCAAVEALGMLGESESVPPLIFVLTTGEYSARRDAAQALIRIGAASIGPALAVLRHPDVEVRRSVAEVLGKVGAHRAVQPLIELLADPAVELREAAVNALGLIGASDAVEALIGALGDADAGVRKEAAMMLGGFRDVRAVGPLCLALWDADMTVRWFAAYSLGLHGDPRAVQPLIRALDDRANNVSQTACDALIKLGDVAVPDLTRNAQMNGGARSPQLLGVLAQIGTPLAEKALASFATDAPSGLGDG